MQIKARHPRSAHYSEVLLPSLAIAIRRSVLRLVHCLILALCVAGSICAADEAATAAPALDLWTLGNASRDAHSFSTLFTAQDVRDRLSSEEGLAKAVQWCKETAVTKVYIESYRDGYQAERGALARAR